MLTRMGQGTLCYFCQGSFGGDLSFPTPSETIFLSSVGNLIPVSSTPNSLVCPSNLVELKQLGLSLLSVSGSSVQMTDTSESADFVYKKRSRHNSLKANMLCSNCRHLVTIIPQAKFASGSMKSRKSKMSRCKKKRLKQ